MNIHNDKPALILTATIIPNANYTSVNDVNIRKKQYLEAIKYYQSVHKGTIYFLENSEYNFANDNEFSELFDENTRLISYPKSKQPNKGKGFQEFEMLDNFINKQLTSKNFIKITGRYLLKNFNEIVPKIDFNTITMDAHQKMKVCITGAFACNIDNYNQFIKNAYKEADDTKNRYIEHVLYDKLVPEKLNKLFPVNPKLEGVSGSYGQSLQRNKYKMLLRNIERTILNKLNINEFLIEY